MSRYVLYSPTIGVFLGEAMGLGFWSGLDCAGQEQAVTFPSPEDLFAYVGTWQRTDVADITAIELPIDRDYATEEDCIKAGLTPWVKEDATFH